jgi:hypothetical protein
MTREMLNMMPNDVQPAKIISIATTSCEIGFDTREGIYGITTSIVKNIQEFTWYLAF